ncbi:MAG: methyltransferase family protein [Candidatus Marinarcus sp.]|uniref:methyltransferase family protein n=1 Tax=Candidatus Marinarcus sp. TaxID=3100987 RepID=UPI003B004254
MKTQKQSVVLVILQFLFVFILLLSDGSITDNGLSLLLCVIGFGIGIWALINNDIYNFNITPELKESGRLIRKGPYEYSRHPMYLALMIIMLGVSIATNEFFYYLIFLALVFVLYLKAVREEYLWNKKSYEYAKYQKRTKMFVPFLF